MATRTNVQAGFAAFLAAALIGTGAILSAPAAYASAEADQPSSQGESVADIISTEVEVTVRETPNEKITIDVLGSGFQSALDQQQEHAAGVSLAVVDANVDLTSIDEDTLPRVNAMIAPDGTLTQFSGPFEASVHALSADSTYQVVSWLNATSLAADTILTRTPVHIDWATLLPASDAQHPLELPTLSSAGGEQAPVAASQASGYSLQVTPKVTIGASLELQVTGAGFGDVQALPGQSEPHAYLALVPQDVDLSTIMQDSSYTNVSTAIRPDGTFSNSDFSAEFVVRAADLDRTVKYEVISWPSRSNPTPDTLYTRVALNMTEQAWDDLFAKTSISTRVNSADPVTGLGLQVNGSAIFDADSSAGVTLAFVKSGTKILSEADVIVSEFFPKVEGNTLQHELSIAPEKLDPEKKTSYEVVLFSGESFNNANERKIVSAVASVTNADWEKIFPDTSELKRIVVDVEIVPNEKVSLLVQGMNFTDVKALPGQDAPHVYLALVPKGADLGTIGQDTNFSNVSVTIRPDGTFGAFSAPFETPAGLLDRTKSYEVIAWPSRSNPTAQNIYTRSDAVIDWDALFPAGAVTGEAKVQNASQLGLTVKTTVKNLDRKSLPDGVQMAVVIRGGSDNATKFYGTPAVVGSIPSTGEVSQVIEIPREELNRHDSYEVVVWPADVQTPKQSNIIRTIPFTVTSAEWDAVFVTTKPIVEQPGAGSLVWGVSQGFRGYTVGKIAKGDMRSSGVGVDGGAYLFPQATSDSWNRMTQTGTVQYSGSVTFWGHKGLMNESFSNPVITVSSPISGSISVAGRGSFPLSMLSGSMTTNSDGSVTWRNVPIQGEICGGGGSGGASGGGCFGLDPVTFTVGSVSGANFGSTVEGNSTKQKRTPADAPPATTGIRVLTAPEKLTAGARIEMEASGFDANDEGILVVLYSEPILLDEQAKADANGVVKWSGTLPDNIELGEHVITLQGSVNAGAVIQVVDKDKKTALESTKRSTVTPQQMHTAGVFGGNVEGMALWEWWATAGGLVLIAGCTTLLAVRQRRAL